MAAVLFRRVRAIDPAVPCDQVMDVGIAEGRVRLRGLAGARWDETLDGAGRLVVAPGFIDLHVHLREPGGEASETIETGTAAAAAGGFTTILAMPNTEPPPDSAERVRALLDRFRGRARVRVLACGTLTAARRGERPAPIEDMAAAGAVAFSDDGGSVPAAGAMLACLRACAAAGRPAIAHAEDFSITGEGVVHEGEVSRRLGLPGILPAAEEIATDRDAALAEAAGARLHVAHVSTARAAGIVRLAKARGASVTAETAPHYLALTAEALLRHGANAKMKPPLRTAPDREGLRAALADGTIDAVATDHAPHAGKTAASDLRSAPFGVVGLETAFAVLATHAAGSGGGRGLRLSGIVARLTAGPARVLGLPCPSLAEGAPADAVLLDPDAEWVVDPSRFLSKGRNTPFAGETLRGRILRTWVAGEEVFRAP